MTEHSEALDKDAILAADDRHRERIEVPEWGGAIYLQDMSGTERDAFEASMIRIRRSGDTAQAEPTFDDARAKLLSKCIVDENGERLFSDHEITQLGSKSGRVLGRLYDRAREINGIGEDDIEDLVGNSGSGPSDTSTSSSVKDSGAPTPITSSAS